MTSPVKLGLKKSFELMVGVETGRIFEQRENEYESLVEKSWQTVGNHLRVAINKQNTN
jgi:hypothetical protein